MHRTIALGSLIAALAAGPFDAVAAQSPRADSLAAVGTVERFHASLAAADSAGAVSLLADDVLVIESGTIQTRLDYLGGHLSADMKGSQGAQGVRTLVKVSMLGDAAYVVSKTMTPPTSAQGSTGSEMAEIMVLSKSSSGWRIRAIHWSSRRRRA